MVDESGEPRLIDFGLAVIRRAHAGVHSETGEPRGLVAGTPGFMAPEQRAGRTDRVGPRTDVYGLGLILRYLLLGGSDTPDRPGSPEDLEHLARLDTPAPLRRALARALAEDPARRFGTADELARDLEAFARPRSSRRLFVAAAAVLLLASPVAVMIFRPFGGPPGGPTRQVPPGPAPGRSPGLSTEQLIAQVRPAAFKVFACGDFVVKTPWYACAKTSEDQRDAAALEKLSPIERWAGERLGRRHGGGPDVDPRFDGPTLVENAFRRDQKDNVVDKFADRVAYCYEKVTKEPEKYLEVVQAVNLSPMMTGKVDQRLLPWVENRREYRDVPYASGSGFAVSREGIVLTNAHVVAEPPSALPDDAMAPVLERTLNDLKIQFGGPCPAEMARDLRASLTAFLAGKSSGEAKRTRVIVVLNYHEPTDEDFIHIAQGAAGAAGAAAGSRRPGTAAAALLADSGHGAEGFEAEIKQPVGEPFPGKDVAVLQLLPPKDLFGTPRWDWKDKLICLPLGDSDRVRPGAAVVAFGYPGAALDFVRAAAKNAADYQPSPQAGKIMAVQPLQTGWSMFQMDAPINHGHSGGPVVDADGRAVALNVAAPTGPDGNPLHGYEKAVPINVAREFLKQAGVTPDPGPVTAHWLAGQALYASEKYAEAAKEFEEVARLQGEAAAASAPAASAGAAKPDDDAVGAFSDVRRVLAECRQRAAGAGKGE